MPGSPHRDKRAMGWRTHRDRIDRVKRTAARRGETATQLVDRALDRECDRCDRDDGITTEKRD